MISPSGYPGVRPGDSIKFVKKVPCNSNCDKDCYGFHGYEYDEAMENKWIGNQPQETK